MKKRFLALLLVFAMVVSLLPSFAMAEEQIAASAATAEDLAAALAAGGTVALSADIALDKMIEVPSGVTATLDLNGHNITVAWADEANGKHIYALNNKGNLTLQDSVGTGSIAARGIYNGYDGSDTANTVAGAKMTVLSGKYIALDTSGGAAIFNCAELIIKDGTFEGIVAAVNNREKGNTIIQNGMFRSVSNYAIQNNGGQMNIHKASVDAGFGAVGCFGGTTTIIDGTYLPTGSAGKTCHVVYVAGAATVDIKGGTFKMNYPADAVPDSGSAATSYYNGTLTISGGTFTSHFDNTSPVELSSGSTITGGTYLTHSGTPSAHSYITTYMAENYVLTNGVVALDAALVAMIGDTYYSSLQAAFDAAQTGDIVTLVADVELDATLTVAAGKTVVLELNGKKLSGVSSAAAASAVILNKGNLTIQDSVGNGRITSEALNPDVNWGGEGEPAYPTYANNTIRNEGALRLLSGTIESTTAAGGASYAIDNYSNGVITIEDGTVIHKNGVAIRLFAGSATNENNLTINGGTVTGGARAVWIQLPSSDANVAPKATFKVTGGTLTSNDTTYNLAVYFYSFGNNAANTDIEISGGTFNGDIAFYGTTLTEDNVSISGGTFNGAYGVYDYYGELAEPVISGGNYKCVYADYVAEGYDAVLVDDYYIVHKHDSLTDIPAVDATCTETGLTAGKKCSICGTVTIAQTVVEKKGHTEVDLPAKEATCTETGLTAGKKCSTCGTVTVAQIVIGQKQHTEVDIPAKEATCTETGLTAGKKCSVCGTLTVAQTVIDKKGHTLTKVPANAATYFATGNIAHYACADCGTLFADAEGTKEVTLADITLAQLVKIEDTTADVSTDAVKDVIQEATDSGKTDIVITVTQDKLAEDNKEDSTDTPQAKPAPVVTKTQLPVAAVEQVADLHEEATLTINMTNATVTMDKTTLDVVTEKAKTEKTDVIALEIEQIKTEELTPVQQTAVEEKTVAAVISASILVNDKEVHDFEGGKVTVAIPFTPEAGTTASDYIVLYVADDGTVEQIPSAFADGKLVLTLSHFSEYVVVNTAAPKDTTNPDTGDGFNPAVMVMLMIASAAGIIILSDKKRFAK